MSIDLENYTGKIIFSYVEIFHKTIHEKMLFSLFQFIYKTIHKTSFISHFQSIYTYYIFFLISINLEIYIVVSFFSLSIEL